MSIVSQDENNLLENVKKNHVVIDDLIDVNLCDNILQEIKGSNIYINGTELRGSNAFLKNADTGYTSIEYGITNEFRYFNEIRDLLQTNITKRINKEFNDNDDFYCVGHDDDFNLSLTSSSTYNGCYIIKFDSNEDKNYTYLPPHVDGGCYSVVLALNDKKDYVGSGVHFQDINETIRLNKGQGIIFKGDIYHSTPKIESGIRYALVFFIRSCKSRLSFISLTYNNEDTILNTLLSVYKHIKGWLICDMGSNDNTINIIKDFFTKNKITGKLITNGKNEDNTNYNFSKHYDECMNLVFNKNIHENRVDFYIYLKPGEILCNNFKRPSDREILSKNMVQVNYKSINNSSIKPLLFNFESNWTSFGGISNIISISNTNYDNVNQITIIVLEKDIYVDEYNNINDIEIYNNELNNGLQCIDNNEYVLHYCFKLSELYYNIGDYKMSLKWSNIFVLLHNYFKTNNVGQLNANYYNSLLFCVYLNLSKIHMKMEMGNIYDIIKYTRKSNELYPIRAEPYYLIGLYFYNTSHYEMSYFSFKTAEEKKNNINNINMNSNCNFVIFDAYSEIVSFYITISCYHTKRFDEFKNRYERLKENYPELSKYYKLIEKYI